MSVHLLVKLDEAGVRLNPTWKLSTLSCPTISFFLSHGSQATSCQNGSGVSRYHLTSSTQTFSPTVMKVA